MDLIRYVCAIALDGKEFTSPDESEAKALANAHNTFLLNEHAKKMVSHVMIFRDCNTDMAKWEHNFGDYTTFYVRILDSEGLDLVNEYFRMLNTDGRTKFDARTMPTPKDMFMVSDIGRTVQFMYTEYGCFYTREKYTLEERINMLEKMCEGMTNLVATCSKHLYISTTPDVLR